MVQLANARRDVTAMRPLALVRTAVLLGCSAAAFGEDTCAFDISGVWEAAPSRSDAAVPARYRFGPDGMVITLSQTPGREGPEWTEATRASRFFYRLDDPRAPSLIEFLGADAASRRGSMEISQFDAGTFTTLDANSEPTRWVRVDPERHFVVFSGARGDVRSGGQAFVTLLRTDAEGRLAADAFGFYLAGDQPVLGAIPRELRDRYSFEPRADSETMLRLELTAAEYARSLLVLRIWERRARENKMLYEVPYLNSVVFVQEMASSLNACGERIRTKKLGWNVGDPITAATNLPQIPFQYMRELRALNEPIHLPAAELRRRLGRACVGICRDAAAR